MNKYQPDVPDDVLRLLATATVVRSNGRLQLVADITERYDGPVDGLEKSKRRAEQRISEFSVLRRRNEYNRRRLFRRGRRG